jgi:uncharacterized protein involved in type VI secretion and phage assembly
VSAVDRGLVDTAAQADSPSDRRIYGVAIGEVIENCDTKNLGRVKVRLAWLPGYEPWARVAVLDGGTFFIPQVGDEVLIGFTNGDVLAPYVLGRLWNDKDPPPARVHGDPVNKRIIRTPKRYEIAFDDAAGSIVITTATDQRITLTSNKIEIAANRDKTTAITLETSGNITIKAATRILLDAPTIDISATDNATLGGSKSARIDGGSYCSVSASSIYIG